MLNRRQFLQSASILTLSGACATPRVSQPPVANDIHSQLNETRLDRIVEVRTLSGIRRAIADARREGKAISIAGGRHAMGGQQFGTGTILLDMRPFNRILRMDLENGLVEVESGIQWPELVTGLLRAQKRRGMQWGIAQKQTGADRLSLGGSLAANIHGRGLTMPPMVGDIEEFTLVDHKGELLRCSRAVNRELFSLAIGGYGLFGVVATITLRLRHRIAVQRIVEIRSIEGIAEAMQERIEQGFTFGDFQYSIDETAPGFLRDGVFSCYKPTRLPVGPERELVESDWRNLLDLAHFDRRKVYDAYTSYYQSTSGQVYWSDTHQMSIYLDEYHRAIDARTGTRATEMITEIYVPRARLNDFMEEARADFLANNVRVIYGTIRLIARDKETFLAWAREPWACVIFNLHVEHTPSGLEHSAEAFRRLIDMAIARGGSYYLTYHRWARKDQVERCYPEMAAFLAAKRKHDPEERFQSTWYRHHKQLLGV